MTHNFVESFDESGVFLSEYLLSLTRGSNHKMKFMQFVGETGVLVG